MNRPALNIAIPLDVALERRLRRYLSVRDRRRFDRAKRFVDDMASRAAGDDVAHRLYARWLKFLCSRAPVQRDIYARDADFLREFAKLFGLPPSETRRFIGLSLLGSIWRARSLQDLWNGPPEFVARLTHVSGWEHFERCRREPAGCILLPVHGQFSRLFIPYLRHRGHEGLAIGLTSYELEMKGFRTPGAKRLELARQMHAAKLLLNRGGMVFNVPDALQNLDNSRSVEFFGRHRRLAAGFAELAVKTAAHVLPFAYRFSPRGHLVLEFGEPLLDPGPEKSPGERSDSLVAQYADFLRGEWHRYPWNIQWHHLRHYCQLPQAVPGALIARGPAVRSAEEKSNPSRDGVAQ